MAATPSNMLPLGTKAPDFNLPDTVSGKNIGLETIKSSKGTVIMFICNHCPFVLHVQKEIVKISQEYHDKGFSFVAISSNDVQNYPQDSPEKMKQHAKTHDFNFPYLYDESQYIAKAYQAACTPDFYVFDANLKLYYRGRMDESTPGNSIPVTGHDLRLALDALNEGHPSPTDQSPSIGCNIKWK
ncbi:MAG: thioredoxin family protein [Bacteroidetes bacterium]|nr:thioredoxin family protein [Bacteroidota bacterium]MDA1119048.1 thioredoxin family protein [Bacteroidota bacterium]